jgi:hypothetical protein
MERAGYTVLAVLIAAGVAIPQDLPPGVLFLSRVKRHIKEELQHLPNISCLESVQREYQPAKGKLRPLDTIRLEVMTNGEKEFYASPGDRKFSERQLIGYAGSGVLGDGSFGLYLKDILVTANVSYDYKGEAEINGRRLARWDYRLPLMWSGQIIRIPEGSGWVGLHGSFWADPQSYDVVRLEMSADDFPPTLPLTAAVTTINYKRTGLGDNVAVLVPESADFRMVKFSGEITHNRIAFTDCRVFRAESTINFDTPDSAEKAPKFGASSIDDTLRPLPGGLQIAVKLRSRISAGMAVGALIEGVVAANVETNGAIVIAAGSLVRGRIRRLERYTDPLPYFVVALEFTEVELQGIRHRFYADLVEIESSRRVGQTLPIANKREVRHHADGGREVRSTAEALSLPKLPRTATFFFKGTTLDLRPGFRTVWKTLTPDSPEP